MSRPPTTHKWDAESHRGLLRAMIEVAKPNKGFITQLATHMQSQGFHTTYSGINQHIQKLRRGQDSPQKAAKSAASTPTKATPTKRKARAPKTATPAKSPAIVEDSDDDDEIYIKQDYDEDDGPDVKRPKVEAKAENTDDGEM
ncbi:hypothetical protein VFPPC_17372 [Pochonia chlamydosporia 170]|uniref:Uncharacterized protein n=1 Tax=Pochonia chlamydosporia 170 TaxID=1380566 RepID=A0A219ASA8_METCM|nr:hypothetical protein VFPPC_17372 [Pochonia chlamydosporia 170]OWT43479.1 hypothetical protein VFPPC_17372 [Pochonia chlamydosporia 170]